MTAKDIAEDFSEFFLEEESVLEIEKPNGEPMLFKGAPVSVSVYGPATDKYSKAQDTMQREATKRLMAAAVKKGKGEKEDPDADIKFLLAITKSINNFPYPGGVEAIYREPKLKYIADQVRGHVNDLGNFFGTVKKA